MIEKNIIMLNEILEVIWKSIFLIVVLNLFFSFLIFFLICFFLLILIILIWLLAPISFFFFPKEVVILAMVFDAFLIWYLLISLRNKKSLLEKVRDMSC